MSNQTPNDFSDDANAPDFLQLLISQQAKYQDSDESDSINLALDESSPPTPDRQGILTTNPAQFGSDAVNLDRWAEQRQSAYASLDAALERHIQEAIRTVNEFKRQAEADAARASYGFVVERDGLVQEIGNLQQEQTGLNRQIEDIRRNVQAEENRQAQARREREELEREVNWLRSQLEETRRTLEAAQLEVEENGGKGRLFGRRKPASPEKGRSLFQAYDAPPVYRRPGEPDLTPFPVVAPVPAPQPQAAPPEPEVIPEPAEVVAETETSGIFSAVAYPAPVETEEVPAEKAFELKPYIPAPAESAQVPAPVEEKVDDRPFPAFAAYVPPPEPVPAPTDEFGDAETPKIPGGSPLIDLPPEEAQVETVEAAQPLTPEAALPVPPVATVVAATPVPGLVAPPVAAQPVQPEPAVVADSGAAAAEKEILAARRGGAHVITSSTFAYLQELLMGEPPEVPLADVAPTPDAASPALGERNHTTTTGPLRLGGTGNLEQTAGLPPRRGQTDPLAARLPRRRHTTGGLGALPAQNAEMATPGPVINPATAPETVAPVPVAARPRRVQPLSETEQQQKVVLRELGLQLGLNDPMTPPALNSMSFAAGYTPPSGSSSLADMLDEINANVSAILPPPSVLEAAGSNGKSGKKVVEPPPPISPDTNLDDYSIEEEPPSPTLQELLEAGEQELAAINDNPTPPENPTPFIGKIGADHPVHFQPGPTITPRPEPLGMLNQELDADKSAARNQSSAPAREFRPFIRPLRGREREQHEINLPLSLTFPPLTNPTNVQQTYVTITNLQGRYTLPMLERILRELVGVGQLVMNEFNQQTLLMEIVHRPKLNLVPQLTTLSDLPLRLVNEAPGTLVFVLNSP